MTWPIASAIIALSLTPCTNAPSSRGAKTGGLRANSLTLESYVTDRWTKQAVNVVAFDNVVIARE